MTFEHSIWLYCTPAVALIMAGLLVLGYRRKDHLLSRFAASRLLGQLTTKGSTARAMIKSLLIVVSAALIAFAMAGPKWGVEQTERKAKGLDIVFILDTSRSMLATDLRPTRLDRAKLAIRDLITRLESDRIGLVAFAGNAFLQTPPTLDYAAFRESLDAVSPKIMTSGGSDLGRALREAANAFPKDNNYKVCILLTDGEDLGGDALEAAKDAAEQQIKIHSIGIGTPEGDYLRILNDAGSEEFIRDADGHPVRSQLDEATLQAIAQTTDGNYYRLSNQSLNTLYQSVLATLPRQELSSEMQEVQIERFQWFLGAAIALYILESLIRRRRARPATALMILGVSLLGLGISPNTLLAQETSPSDQTVTTSTDARVIYNQAHDLLKQGEYAAASQAFADAVKNTDNLSLQADALYNQGHAVNQLGEAALKEQDMEAAIKNWKEAEALFTSAREIQPNDQQAQQASESLHKRREALEAFVEKQKQAEQPDQDQSSDQQSDENSDQKDQPPQDGEQSSESGQDGEQPDSSEQPSENGQESGEQPENQDGQSSSDQSSPSEGSQSENEEPGNASESTEDSESQNADTQPSDQSTADDEQPASEEARSAAEPSGDENEEQSEGMQSTADPRDDLPENNDATSAQSPAEAGAEPTDAEGTSTGAQSTGTATPLTEEEISQQEARALLDSLRNSERLLPYSPQSSQPQKRDQRDW